MMPQLASSPPVTTAAGRQPNFVSNPSLDDLSAWQEKWLQDKYSDTQRYILGRYEQSAAEKAQTAKEKAQARRAQVRRAQIRHRQRKADYIKQLELDISQLRHMVAAAEAEAVEMQRSNQGIRSVLAAAGVARLPEPSMRQYNPVQQTLMTATNTTTTTTTSPKTPKTTSTALYPSSVSSSTSSQTPQMRRLLLEMDPNQLVPADSGSTELFAGIDMNDITVSLSMNDVLGTPSFTISPISHMTGAASVDGAMTPEQETRAINFILALEHGCWDHFLLGDFHGHDDHHIDTSDGGHGHHLMATSYLMSSAPESIYTERNVFEAPPVQPQSQSHSFHWSSAGMSLASLYGLALSLNHDTREITPVQAWFELAARYPPATLFAGGALDALEVEFSHATRCVLFGAVMSRADFEDITERVLGPWPQGPVPLDLPQWMYAPCIEGPL